MNYFILRIKKNNLSLLFILFLASILRLVNLNQSFWLDEAAQVIESIRPFNQQFQLAADFHPPLYHLILHFWLYFGQSEIWVRLLSVFFGIISVAVLYKLAKTISDDKTAAVAALLLATSAYHVWYSQEARPYMLFLLLSLLSVYFLIQKNWFLFTVFIVLSLYTNYFSIFLIFGILTYGFFNKKGNLQNILISMFIALILYLPWVPEFILQFRTGTNGMFSGWSEVVSEAPVKAILLNIAKFSVGKVSLNRNPLFIILILPVLGIFIYSIWNISKNPKLRYLLIILLAPVAAAFLVSFIIPVLAPQRLIFLLPVFVLIISIGIVRLRNSFRYILLAVLLVVNLSGIINYYTDPYIQREQWKQAVEFVEISSFPHSIALFVFPDPFAPYLWYSKSKVVGYGIAPEFILKDKDLKYLGGILEGKSRIYLFQYLTGLTDPKNLTGKYLQASGFQNTLTRDFSGVGFVYVYDKK